MRDRRRRCSGDSHHFPLGFAQATKESKQAEACFQIRTSFPRDQVSATRYDQLYEITG